MPLSPGDKLGPYEIVLPIGAGGMGEVYKARDTRLHRTVAIKTSKLQFTERFEREAQAIAALNHPNICTLHDVGPNYLVMELVDGQPLKGPLSLEKTLHYAAQICDALTAAHAKGITHRDLKPANILVTKQGIKLLDFGLAKRTSSQPVTDDTVTQALTGEGIVLGTPQYMAPEQIEGREADARSDIFALGCVLYEMVTGRKAFEGKTASSVAAAILAREPEPLQPTALQRVIHSCLAKDPADRWQSAHDVKLALAGVSNSPDSPARQSSTRIWQIAAGICALLALAASAALFLRPQKPGELIRFQVSDNIIETSRPETPAISPDGRKLAFFSNRVDGRRQVYVRRLDALKSTPIPGTEGASGYFWSPDSNSLGFTLNATLNRVDLASGNVTQLASNVDRFAIWTVRDVIVFRTAVAGPLLQVPAGGGEATPATHLSVDLGEVSHVNITSCGPDGRFLYRTLMKDGSSIWRIGSLTGRPPVTVQGASRLVACAALPGSRHFLLSYRNGSIQARRLDLDTGASSGPAVTLVAGLGTADDNNSGVSHFSSSQTGTLAYRTSGGADQSLRWYDRQGKPLPGPASEMIGSTPALSPDESRLAVGRSSAVWVTDVVRRTSMRLVQGDLGNFLPAWSPDGKRVAFSMGNRVVEAEANGLGEPRTLATVSNWVQQYSPDGKSILFVDTSRMALQMASVRGNQPPVDVGPPGPTYFPATFSPDGRFIAYSSGESGRGEIYVRAIPPATGKWLVSTNGGGMAAWRSDGRELYYLSPDLDMMAVDVQFSPTFQPSAPRVLFRAKVSGNNNARNNYAVSRDGRRFLIATYTAEAIPISVIVNWPAMLSNSDSP